MIELTVLNYLAEQMSVPVYMEMPAEMPDSFVLVEKTGSGRDNRIDRATIAIQSYAPTLYEAAALNDAVKEAMDGMAYAENVFMAKLNSDYNYTDTSVKRYRYQAVYDMTY
ncbi:MAG: hypothetical protein IKH17_06375 [Bacteroidales bacterium]|nr:hypothetical protein [Bacteroidales bacterium]